MARKFYEAFIVFVPIFLSLCAFACVAIFKFEPYIYYLIMWRYVESYCLFAILLLFVFWMSKRNLVKLVSSSAASISSIAIANLWIVSMNSYTSYSINGKIVVDKGSVLHWVKEDHASAIVLLSAVSVLGAIVQATIYRYLGGKRRVKDS